MKLLLSLISAVAAINVPNPTGPFSVARHVLPLTDNSRLDPYAPSPQPRKILVSFYLPVREKCVTERVPYMTPAIAEEYGQMAVQIGLPNDTFTKFTVDYCNLKKMVSCSRQNYPVAIFSPGLGNSRLIYGVRAQSLASHGYIVVSIDHPYDALTEFPDGTIIQPVDISDDDDSQLSKDVAVSFLSSFLETKRSPSQVRRDDISFLVDQLHNKTLIGSLLRRYPGALDLNHIAVIGHSIGGTAAAAVAAYDIRVLGGANLDGRLVNPILSSGLSKPFLQLGRQNHTAEDPTWNQFWPHLKGKKSELAIADTQHGTFEDFLPLLALLNLPSEIEKVVQDNLGRITPKEMDSAINSALSAFFDLIFHGNATPLKNINRTPKISVLRSSL